MYSKQGMINLFGYLKTVEKFKTFVSTEFVQYSISDKKEVDLTALNMLAMRSVKNLCSCKYFCENSNHIFRYDVSNLLTLESLTCSNQDIILLLESLYNLLIEISKNDLKLSNISVLHSNIYFNNQDFLFIYVPAKIIKKETSINSFIDQVLSGLKTESRLIKLVVKAIKKGESAVTTLQSFLENSNLHNDNSNTFSEGETTLFGNTSADCFSEGETTLFGNTSADSFSEGETTMFKDTMKDLSPDDETTLLSDYSTKSVNIGDRSREIYLVRSVNGESFNISSNKVEIGSIVSPGNIQINNRSISRRHATIIIERDCVYIIDNNSTNGTVVDGMAVDAGVKMQIYNGSFLTMGDETFQIIIK